MQRPIMLLLGVMLILGGLVGASRIWTKGGEVRAQDLGFLTATDAPQDEAQTTDTQSNQLHVAMHAMMDQMMNTVGEVERMHAMMHGSEAMMEACATGMSIGGMRDGSE